VKLRHKFGVVALIYVVSLAANMAVSGWCIVIYFNSAFTSFESALGYESMLEQWRVELNRWVELAKNTPGSSGTASSPAQLKRKLEDRAAKFAQSTPAELDGTIRQAIAQSQQRVLHADRADIPAASKKLDALLTDAVEEIRSTRHDAVAQADQTQQRIVRILMINATAGGLLCLIGLLLIRRWVLQPVEALRVATREIAGGNFAHRVDVRTDDELGQLGTEVNQMSATIVDMQARLVDTERLAAAGEMVARVAHNIRNPLAGIRGLAEGTAHRAGDDNGMVENQRRIIESVDRFEQWLRKLQQDVSPLRLQPAEVDVDALVHNVSTALQPMADRRGVAIDLHIDPAARHVCIDGVHFEQALVALLTNAIQASGKGQRVTVSIGPMPDEDGKWKLAVEDHGEGVPDDVADRIFEPYFTTKPDGTGLGLAMANKVIRIHGGRMSLKSSPGNGTRFDVIMPKRVKADG